MKKQEKQVFIGKLINFKRLRNSYYGNPKYYGVFQNANGEILEGTTKTDASFVYRFLNDQENNREVKYHFTQKGKTIIDDITVLEF